ncbi:hypothetical protein GGI02_004622, partial [Coemansia sp. RSA 2322]
MVQQQANYEGRLEIQVVAGRELPKRGVFGRQDSAVELHLGTAKKRCRADKKGGAAPEWNDRLFFTISGLGKTQLYVRAVEIESSVTVKDIGSCVVDLVKIFEEEEVDGWYPLKYKDKPAGDVYLEFTYTPKGGRKRPHVEPPRDDDEDIRLQVAPKFGKASAAEATAPSLPPAPHVGLAMSRPQSALVAPSGSQTVPVGGSAAMVMRQSVSDLRPYSSASMYNPELAIKYANKHGKKPLPAAPSPAGLSMGFDNPVPLDMQQQQQQHPGLQFQQQFQQQQPMQGYDQTMMPGQFMQASQPYAQQIQQFQHQQQQMLPMAHDNGMTMGPSAMGTMLPQQAYQQQ